MADSGSIGRYKTTAELGRGAMGVVYRGVDPALDRPVAIKVIAAKAVSGDVSAEEMEARFLREAKVSARINHPNVVTVYDAGREGDVLYLVMELVEGESLAHRLARGAYPEPDEALSIVAQMAEALAAAHAMGVVHRDIKPANVLITREGRIKVSDFGIAKAIGDDMGLTRSGVVVGSPAYMAPEQVRGAQVDGRADLFSLGVVLYELVTRRRPFPADTVTTLIYQILNEDPLAKPDVWRSLGDEMAGFLKWCLAKEPTQRIPDATTFAARARALRPLVAAIQEGSGVATAMIKPGVPTTASSPAAAPPPPMPVKAPAAKGKPGRKLPVVPLVIVAAGALALALAMLVLRHKAPPASDVIAAATEMPQVVPTAVVPVVVVPTVVPTPVPPPTPVPTRALPTPTPTPPIVAVFACSRGAEFHVSPEDAQVLIDGKVIGIADDWDGMGGGKAYLFPGPGIHYARFSMAGYRTAWVKIEVRPGAKGIVKIDTELDELDR